MDSEIITDDLISNDIGKKSNDDDDDNNVIVHSSSSFYHQRKKSEEQGGGGGGGIGRRLSSSSSNATKIRRNHRRISRRSSSTMGSSSASSPSTFNGTSATSATTTTSGSERSAQSSPDPALLKKKRRKKRKRPLNAEEKLMREKYLNLERGLLNNDVKLLKKLTVSDGGLLHDANRRRVWPKLVGIDTILESSILPTQEEIENHKQYNQVVLDVNRSLKRFPPGIAEEQRPGLQEQLTRLIIRVLMKHPELHYYQGYHDVAITFLLVVGEELGYHMTEKLSVTHLKHFMAPTMEKTTHYLHYIYPIIERMNPDLFQFLERSELGTIFALPWVITWFGHVLTDYSDVVRLYDFFMVQPPLMPVYFAAALVLYRETEILLNCDCDMASIHALLSRIPVVLPFEKLLTDALFLYEEYPPSEIEPEVQIRIDLINKALEKSQHEAMMRRKKLLKNFKDKSSSSSAAVVKSSWFSYTKAIFISTAPVVIGVIVWRLYNQNY